MYRKRLLKTLNWAVCRLIFIFDCERMYLGCYPLTSIETTTMMCANVFFLYFISFTSFCFFLLHTWALPACACTVYVEMKAVISGTIHSMKVFSEFSLLPFHKLHTNFWTEEIDIGLSSDVYESFHPTLF